MSFRFTVKVTSIWMKIMVKGKASTKNTVRVRLRDDIEMKFSK